MSSFAPNLGGRVSRRGIALSPHLWFALWVTFAIFGASCIPLAFVFPGVDQQRVLALAAVLCATSWALHKITPPEPDSWRWHAILSLTYVGPALAIWAYEPAGAAVVASSVFVGQLAPVWLLQRRQVAAHCLAAAGVLLIAAAASGNTDTILTTVAIIPGLWVLAACSVLILEAAEAQDRELSGIVRKDSLTSAGNRRRLDEDLKRELERHRRDHRALAVIALDLNGFKDVNLQYGHTAGDELLRLVADELSALTSEQDTVARLDSDHFYVLLADTSAEEATTVISEIRDTLLKIDLFDEPVTAGLGVASFPADGSDPRRLLQTAGRRVQASKALYAGRREMEDPTRDEELAASHRAIVEAVSNSPTALSNYPLEADETDWEVSTEVLVGSRSRTELAADPIVWRAMNGMFLLLAAFGASVCLWWPDLAKPGLAYVAATGAALGLALLFVKPIKIGTALNHVLVALIYLLPAITVVMMGSLATVCALFVGSVIALRLIDRKQILAHLLAATAAFDAAFIVVDPSARVTILIVITTMWVLAITTAVMFEAAEEQSLELERLVRRDPLTGAANRRLLDERLPTLLAKHAGVGAPLTLLALDINGFKQFNRVAGHAAGDALLKQIAAVIQTVSRTGDIVVRQSGDKFCVVLRGTSAADAPESERTLRLALAAIECNDEPVTAAMGTATFPADGESVDALLATAEGRLLDRKPGKLGQPATAGVK